jgi:NADH:ubiquinone oxidoreductase subunit F (NADH-binding)
VVGKVVNTGLVEVPMGITMKEIVYDIGGGVPDGKKLKGVQTGGPSGGRIPESLVDLPIDYERLAEAGSIMGSGGLIVLDEDTCMVDLAGYFLDFLRSESCGKCTTCREGISAMHDIVADICGGNGQPEHIPLLEDIAEAVKDASLCALGGNGAQPRSEHAAVLPRRVRGTHQRQEVPRRRLPGADRIPDRPREMQRVHAMHQGLPAADHSRGEEGTPDDRCRTVHQVWRVSRAVQV